MRISLIACVIYLYIFVMRSNIAARPSVFFRDELINVYAIALNRETVTYCVRIVHCLHL
jgi:hypothetical protein